MNTSYKKIAEFIKAGNVFLSEHNGAETKLSASVSDMVADMAEVQGRYFKQMKKIQRNYAYADKATGVIVKDASGNYQYNKIDEEKLDAELDSLFEDERHFDITPDIQTGEEVDKLERAFKRAFKGFITE